MSEYSEEERIKTVRTFHDQAMAAVLDGRELLFFDLLENYFQKLAQKHYDKGFHVGWNAALEAAAAITEANEKDKKKRW